MHGCSKCGLEMARTDVGMLRHWLAETGAISGSGLWEDRLGTSPTLVCPKCDAYALGLDLPHGLPFYSESPGAYLTMTDWDWCNRDPQECDIRGWPIFGCLTFSESALRSTVEYLRGTDSKSLTPAAPLPTIFELTGPTGIAEDDDAEQEWADQLRVLDDRMRGDCSLRELDVAVRTLVRALLNASEK